MGEPRGFRRWVEGLHGGQLLLLMFAIVALGLPVSAVLWLFGLDQSRGGQGNRLLVAAAVLVFAVIASLFALPWIWFGGRVKRRP